jgi:hypothetical protein
MDRRRGFEPLTLGFEDQRSSTELTTDGTTARNQTWFSAFAGLRDVHFTTVIKPGTRRCRAGMENHSKRPGLQGLVGIAAHWIFMQR